MECCEQPRYYTSHEGAEWQSWAPILKINEEDLKKHADTKNGDPFVIISGVRVHSLRFWNPVNGFRRWDCLNGWTQ